MVMIGMFILGKIFLGVFVVVIVFKIMINSVNIMKVYGLFSVILINVSMVFF